MSQVAATKDSKDAENGASLFRKSEQENKALQAEIQHLKFEKVTADSAQAKVEEEESTRLRIELEKAHADFAKEKKELEMTYMKQVDDMYFQGYGRCMQKHGIQDILSSENYSLKRFSYLFYLKKKKIMKMFYFIEMCYQTQCNQTLVYSC